MTGEQSVGELVEALGIGQANVSKHLRLMLADDLVTRRKDGLFAVYRIADESVFQLCELVCTRLEMASQTRHRQLAAR